MQAMIISCADCHILLGKKDHSFRQNSILNLSAKQIVIFHLFSYLNIMYSDHFKNKQSIHVIVLVFQLKYCFKAIYFVYFSTQCIRWNIVRLLLVISSKQACCFNILPNALLICMKKSSKQNTALLQIKLLILCVHF